MASHQLSFILSCKRHEIFLPAIEKITCTFISTFQTSLKAAEKFMRVKIV